MMCLELTLKDYPLRKIIEGVDSYKDVISKVPNEILNRFAFDFINDDYLPFAIIVHIKRGNEILGLFDKLKLFRYIEKIGKCDIRHRCFFDFGYIVGCNKAYFKGSISKELLAFIKTKGNKTITANII